MRLFAPNSFSCPNVATLGRFLTIFPVIIWRKVKLRSISDTGESGQPGEGDTVEEGIGKPLKSWNSS